MFVVDAAVLLPYPPHVVARVVERLHALPRWCSGLRRVRHAAALAEPEPPAGCVFTYESVGGRLTLRGRTLEREPDAPGEVRHEAAGDGVTLVWSYAAESEDGGEGEAPRTRLRARTSVEVDPDHPVAAGRAALCRQVARRAPTDLERLRALLDRYEFGKTHGRVTAEPAGVAPARAAE